MVTDKILKNKESFVYLKSLKAGDCSDEYVSWLNDPKVNQHLESKWSRHTLQSTVEFVENMERSPDHYLFGIFLKENHRHIGNIKIGPISSHYHHAYIGYMIGDVNYWGKGIATEVIGLVCKFSFDELQLHRVKAGAYATAVGSWRALEKNGFQREGISREEIFIGGRYIDTYQYGLIDIEREMNG